MSLRRSGAAAGQIAVGEGFLVYPYKFSVILCLCVAWAAHAQTITGTITTLAGNGTRGFAGDNGPALSANMNQPFAAVSVGGKLYIADQVNCVVRLVDSSGKISTIAGNAIPGFSGDGGPATAAQLSQPSGIAVDSSGNIYIADTGNSAIRKVDTSGKISTFAGIGQNPDYNGDGGGAAGASLNKPSGLAFDSKGALYVADSGNNVIRKIAMDAINTITTYAGNFAKGGSYTGDGQTALNAGMSVPVGITFDNAGNLYIADSNNNVVRKVASNLIISTVAGNGTAGFSGDGTRLPTLSQLSHPKGVAVDGAGNVYIADSVNSRIRVVPPNGASINTVIGNGQAAYYGDNGPASQAAINNPGGLSFDSSGNLIISDTVNNVIRKFAPGAATGSKPAISAGGVISAGEFGALSNVAPGSWIEIYGTNLANTTTDWTSYLASNGNKAPTTLGGTTVTIGGLNAYLDYVSPLQVNVQIPFGVTLGTQQLVVSTAAGQSANYSLNVLNTAPGLWAPNTATYNIGGKQYVGAQHADGSWVLPSNPAKVGETVVLYGNGFGPVSPQQTDGQLVQNSNNSITTPLTVLFGSNQATVSYKGLVAPYLGLYQFNVVVPNVASGSAIPLSFLLGTSTGTQTLYTAVQ